MIPLRFLELAPVSTLVGEHNVTVFLHNILGFAHGFDMLDGALIGPMNVGIGLPRHR